MVQRTEGPSTVVYAYIELVYLDMTLWDPGSEGTVWGHCIYYDSGSESPEKIS